MWTSLFKFRKKSKKILLLSILTLPLFCSLSANNINHQLINNQSLSSNIDDKIEDLHPIEPTKPKQIRVITQNEASQYPYKTNASFSSCLAANPIVGGNTYGYNWLHNTASFTTNEKNVMVAIYDALSTWAIGMYNDQNDFLLDQSGDFSTCGRIDFDQSVSSQLPLDGVPIPIAMMDPSRYQTTDHTIRLVCLSYVVFTSDNPQYYQILPGYPQIFDDGAHTYIEGIAPLLADDCVAKRDRVAIESRMEQEYQKYYVDVLNSQNSMNNSYDIVRTVHDMICAKTDYYYNQNGRPDDSPPAHDIRGVLDPGSTGPVCESFAEAFCYIINRLNVSGLEAIKVGGFAGNGGNGGGGGHAWNLVKLNGAWYSLDITWDNLDNTNPTSSQYDNNNQFNLLYYKYFLCGTNNTDWGNGTTHRPSNPFPTSITNDYFSYEFPTISTSDYNRSPVGRNQSLPTGTSRYLTDNGFYGKNNFGSYDFNTQNTQDDYDYLITKTAHPVSSDINDNPLLYYTGSNYQFKYGSFNLGNYYPGKHIPLYRFPYSNSSGSVNGAFSDYADRNDPSYSEPYWPCRIPLIQDIDYTVSVEQGNVGDTVRIWFYGKGNYKGVDFALVTLAATPIVDTTPPVVSNGTINRTSNTNATIGFTTDEGGTVYYRVYNSGAPTPTKQQVKQGTSLGLVNAGTITGKPITLTSGAKDVYVIVEDSSGNISDPLKIIAHNYLPPDTTPPGLSNGTYTRTSDTTGTIGFTTNEAGTAYYLVKSHGSSSPSKNDVKTLGIDLGHVNATTINKSIILTSGAKDVYVIVEDSSGNISNPLKIQIPEYVPPSTDTVINLNHIHGVGVPSIGITPTTTITETEQYTGTISWGPTITTTFEANTIYTATITLIPKSGWTLYGVSNNFFIVNGSTATSNAINSGIIIATFPKTANDEQEQNIDDNAAVVEAKKTVEETTYIGSSIECYNEVTTYNKIISIIDNLQLNGVSFTIEAINYVPHIDGTFKNWNGKNGQMLFKLLLHKGATINVETINLTMIITAKKFTFPIWLIIVIAGAALLVILSIILITIYRRKHKNKKN